MENEIFEIKSFAKIKYFKEINGENIFFSEKINFFDKIFFEEKEKNFGGIEIRKKSGDFGNIKFPTNHENYCFLAAKEMQKFFAKKYKGLKPKSIKITIEKNIPLNSGLGGAVSNGFETLNFLNNFWEINLPEGKILEIGEKIFPNEFKNISLEENNFNKNLNNHFSDKKIFILIPKYISIEKNFFENIFNNSQNFIKSQNKIKKIFPDLEKFIKIFLENGAEFSDISGKGSGVFGVFDKNFSEEKIENLKIIFSDFGELKFCK